MARVTMPRKKKSYVLDDIDELSVDLGKIYRSSRLITNLSTFLTSPITKKGLTPKQIKKIDSVLKKLNEDIMSTSQTYYCVIPALPTTTGFGLVEGYKFKHTPVCENLMLRFVLEYRDVLVSMLPRIKEYDPDGSIQRFIYRLKDMDELTYGRRRSVRSAIKVIKAVYFILYSNQGLGGTVNDIYREYINNMILASSTSICDMMLGTVTEPWVFYHVNKASEVTVPYILVNYRTYIQCLNRYWDNGNSCIWHALCMINKRAHSYWAIYMSSSVKHAILTRSDAFKINDNLYTWAKNTLRRKDLI
jgi:hypothetical protein